MREHGRWLWAAGLLAGTAAVALSAGDRVYVRARDTALMKSTAPTANTVLKLQPGDAVTWRGADKVRPKWHLVQAKGASGFVYYANLSTTPPNTELLASPAGNRPVDAQAFASSGAATKALTEGAVRYGNQDEKNKGDLKPSMRDAVKQVLTLEAIALQRSPEELAAQSGRIREGTR